MIITGDKDGEDRSLFGLPGGSYHMTADELVDGVLLPPAGPADPDGVPLRGDSWARIKASFADAPPGASGKR